VLQTKLLSEALRRMTSMVVEKIVPSPERVRKYAESSPALITVISPRIGYDKAALVAKQLAKGVPIRSALKDLGFTPKEIEKILDLGGLVRPGIPSKNL
jgi:fumarate hydratase class II